MPPTTAYIALGSNLGDRAANLEFAVARLRHTPGIEVIRISSSLENPAIGGPDDSPPFLNAAVEIRTTIAPHALLKRLLEIERELGRTRRQKWEPRTIDLDLLLYGDQILSSQELIVPHPLMHERRFVIQPLAEIAPNVVHPTLEIPISMIMDNLAHARSVMK